MKGIGKNISLILLLFAAVIIFVVWFLIPLPLVKAEIPFIYTLLVFVFLIYLILFIILYNIVSKNSPRVPKYTLFLNVNENNEHRKIYPYFFGGQSWQAPWIAGLYALCVQVNTNINPDVFYDSIYDTGDSIKVDVGNKSYVLFPVINPVRLIEKIRKY